MGGLVRNARSNGNQQGDEYTTVNVSPEENVCPRKARNLEVRADAASLSLTTLRRRTPGE
jgi:hypothetical protein